MKPSFVTGCLRPRLSRCLRGSEETRSRYQADRCRDAGTDADAGPDAERGAAASAREEETLRLPVGQRGPHRRQGARNRAQKEARKAERCHHQGRFQAPEVVEPLAAQAHRARPLSVHADDVAEGAFSRPGRVRRPVAALRSHAARESARVDQSGEGLQSARKAHQARSSRSRSHPGEGLEAARKAHAAHRASARRHRGRGSHPARQARRCSSSSASRTPR